MTASRLVPWRLWQPQRTRLTRRWLTLGLATVGLAIGLRATASAAKAKPFVPMTGPEGVALLNQQREANGIPGGLVEDAHLSEGCRDRVTYYHDAPEQYDGHVRRA